MSLSDTATQLRQRADKARSGAEHALERATEGAEIARERATESAEWARERASEAIEAAEPVGGRVMRAVKSLVRVLFSLFLTGPGVLAKVLGILSNLLSGVTERGREIAARVDPPKAERRKRRLAAVGWFAGGFAAGTAAGWVVHSRMNAEEPVDYAAPAPFARANGQSAPSAATSSTSSTASTPPETGEDRDERADA